MGPSGVEGSASEGDVLCGKYRLDKLLGRGGMGSVFRAKNVLIGRDVAVKVLRAEHAQNPGIVARFLREAQAANLVRHPNAVDVLDIGQDEHGRPFIVQELLVGEDLATTAEREDGKLPVDVVLQILLPILEALALGHANGVVHRDLKPENVFLARYGSAIVPKLLDFGISQVRPEAGEERLTQAGAIVGTPQYMSPEQVRSGQVDARADVWAMGVLLYELIAGRRPFIAPVPAIYVAICGEDPVPLEDAAPGVPNAIARIVHRCLLREKELRFADAGELRDALAEVHGRPVPSGVPAKSASGRAGAGAATEAPARDEPVPEVPSLPPPPPPMPTASNPAPVARPAAAPPPPPEPLDDFDDEPRARTTSGLTLDYVSSSPPRTISYARMPNVPPPMRVDASAPLVAIVAMAAGAGVGLVASFLTYDALHLEVAVARIQPDAVRFAIALAALAAGAVVGTRTYRGLRDDAAQGKLAVAVGGLLAAICLFVTLKLLSGG